MQVHRTNYQINETPTLQVLTEDQIEAIYYAALRVLYETGVRVYDKEALKLPIPVAQLWRIKPMRVTWCKFRIGW